MALVGEKLKNKIHLKLTVKIYCAAAIAYETCNFSDLTLFILCILNTFKTIIVYMKITSCRSLIIHFLIFTFLMRVFK